MAKGELYAGPGWSTGLNPDQPARFCSAPCMHAPNGHPRGTRTGSAAVGAARPVVYDRRVAERLWGFDYAWEVYTPPAKRQRGYYALPVLAGTELVGHVDPKADREAGRLRVLSRRVRRGCRVAPAVKALAAFLGLNGVGNAKGNDRGRTDLRTTVGFVESFLGTSGPTSLSSPR